MLDVYLTSHIHNLSTPIADPNPFFTYLSIITNIAGKYLVEMYRFGLADSKVNDRE